jgi:hypothetical protein
VHDEATREAAHWEDATVPTNRDGERYAMLRVEECDRDALMVALRLVNYVRDRWDAEAVKGIRDCFRNGAGYCEPSAVAINLGRMAEDWDAEAAQGGAL